MSIPAGVQIGTVTFGAAVSFTGRTTTARLAVEPSARLVYNGIPVLDFVEEASATDGQPGQMFLPVCDQPGFKATVGGVVADFSGWSYKATLTWTDPVTKVSKQVTKVFQILSGQTTIDFDDLPDTVNALPVTAPTAQVTSFLGKTGAIVEEDLDELDLGLSEAAVDQRVEEVGVSRYAPLGPRLFNPAGLRRFRAKLGDCVESRVVVTVIGHSIVFGKGAANINTENDIQAKDAGWVGRLRRSFTTQTGIDPGEGWLKFDDSRRTGTGATSSPNTSMVAKGLRLDAGSSLTFTLPPCTDIDIAFWKNAPNSTGVPTYAVDGGTPVTPPASTAADDTFPFVSVTGLADAAHTLTLTGPASGYAYVSGVRPRRGSTIAGIEVNRLGIAGAVLNDLSAPSGNPTNKLRVRRATVEGTKADLLVIQCDTNDEAAATAVATWKADMQAWVDVAVAAGACVLILGDPRKNGATNEDAYAAASRELAGANTHVSYLRIADWWGSYSQGNELGLYNSGSTVHPGRRGHGDVARVVHDAITGRLNAGVIAPV